MPDIPNNNRVGLPLELFPTVLIPRSEPEHNDRIQRLVRVDRRGDGMQRVFQKVSLKGEKFSFRRERRGRGNRSVCSRWSCLVNENSAL
jgi:hypothetical protein